MNTLQRSSSRTLHLRRDAASTTSVAVRSVQRGTPVLVRTTAAVASVSSAASSSAAPANQPAANNSSALPSESLLRGAKVVQIMHNGESYQLRATRHGKLILTK